MIIEQLQSDQIQAMKSGDRQKVEVLRYILSQIKNKEVDKRAPLTEEEVVQILRKQMKEMQDSITAFKAGNRQDLVDGTQAQLDILMPYLPKELSDEDLEKEVQKVLDDNKALIEKTPKMAIGLCMKELRSKASPERIMKVLQSKQA